MATCRSCRAVAGDRANPGLPSISSLSRWLRWRMRACARRQSRATAAGWPGVEMSVSWFLGENDAGVPMLDDRTGGGSDGLSRDGRSRNQGAESTLAMISVLQQPVACRCPAVTGDPPPSGLLSAPPCVLKPDASRTLCRIFVPGNETMIHGESRAMAVLDRVLSLSEAEAEATLARTLARFSDRHRDLAGKLERNFELVAHRLGSHPGRAHAAAADRRLLHSGIRDRGGSTVQPVHGRASRPGWLPAGRTRFIMSLRAVGEGHLSSIEFRTGTVSDEATIWLDPPGRFPDTGIARPVPYDREFFRGKISELLQRMRTPSSCGADCRPASPRPSWMPRSPSSPAASPAGTLSPGRRVRWMAASNYAVEFDDAASCPSGCCGRLARPRATAWKTRGSCASPTPAKRSTTRPTRRSMAGRSRRTCCRPPTSGRSPSPRWPVRRRRTRAWRCFPRRIAGRYAALSRWDRESNAIAYSSDGYRWGRARYGPDPSAPMGAGPARQLRLADRDPGGMAGLHSRRRADAGVRHRRDPARPRSAGALLAALPEPLLIAAGPEREGYVPNVVYSCGGCCTAEHRPAVRLQRLVRAARHRGLPRLLARMTRA